MAIPREYVTSNPVASDMLAMKPPPRGNRAGDFVAPDFPIDSETVDILISADHALNLDDLRAPDAEAKEIRFETGTTATRSIIEHGLKNKMDSRKIEEAGDRGTNLIVERSVLLRDDILDAKEYRIAGLVMAAANYGGTHKVNGTNWRTADLYGTIAAQNEVIIADGRYPANRGIIGRTAWNAARLNAGFNAFVAGPNIKASGKDLTLARFAEYLGLEEVRLADFQRAIGPANTITQFWPLDSFLLFFQQDTLAARTLAVTPVCPYGQYQDAAQGTLVDVRVDKLSGTERLTEVGAYHRYLPVLANANLGFLSTGIIQA